MTPRFLLSISLLLSSIAASHAQTVIGLGHPDAASDRYIVVYRSDALQRQFAGKDGVSAMAIELNQTYAATVHRNYEHAMKGAAVSMTLENAARLAKDPRVEFVEIDGKVSAADIQHDSPWGLNRIDQYNNPTDGNYRFPTSAGSGVHAYILDTGIRDGHTEFANRVGIGVNLRSLGTGPPVTEPGNPMPQSTWDDCQGHGTEVAGVLGGTTFGVAKRVTLHAVKVLGCNDDTRQSDIIAGIDWVRANHVKPAVVNMSIQGSPSQALDNAIANLTSAGVLSVVAAGNFSDDACMHSPARAPSALTVASVDQNDALSTFSSFGSCVDVNAPGEQIPTADLDPAVRNLVVWGTSVAAPHVAGAAALFLSNFPAATPAQVTAAIKGNVGANGVVNTSFVVDGFVPGVPEPLLVTSNSCYGDNHMRWTPTIGATYYELWAARTSAFGAPWLYGQYDYVSTIGDFPRVTFLKARACNATGCGALTSAKATAYVNRCD